MAANNINSLEDISSIGNPIFNSTPKKASFIERHNRSAGLLSQDLISDPQNVSLGTYTGTVHLNILTDTSTADLKEIERLTNKLQAGQQNLREISALNETLVKKQSDLAEKITPLNAEVRDQELQVRNLTRKYKSLTNQYQHELEVFGMNTSGEAEEYLGTIKKLSPALDALCELCDNQRASIDDLYAKLEELTEEKQSYTWKNAVEKEQEIQARSQKYIATLDSAYDKSTARLETQKETIKELKEEIETVDAENSKMGDLAHIRKLQALCNDLDTKLKSLAHSNEDLKRQNAELASRPRGAKTSSAVPAPAVGSVSAQAAGSVPAQAVVGSQTTQDLRRKCLDLKSQLNGEFDASVTILDNDQTLTPNSRPQLLSQTPTPGSTLYTLSGQVNDVKKEVQGMKEVLEQSKQALKEMLPSAQTAGARLNKSVETPAVRRLKIRQRLNKTY